MNDKFKGFVLSISDYKDNDVLMQVISKEYGIISLVAKAAKKINSKNHFLPMCLYEFIIDYKYGKTIYTIHGFKVLAKYFEDKDIEMMSFKNIICELSLKNKDINNYNNLIFFFENINKESRYLLGSLFISALIKEYGVMPIVDRCVMCDSKKVVSISNMHGGFLCIDHLNGNNPLPVDRLKKFRIIIKASFDNYDVLKDYQYDFKDFEYVMSFFLEHSDLILKSYELYKTINI